VPTAILAVRSVLLGSGVSKARASLYRPPDKSSSRWNFWIFAGGAGRRTAKTIRQILRTRENSAARWRDFAGSALWSRPGTSLIRPDEREARMGSARRLRLAAALMGFTLAAGAAAAAEPRVDTRQGPVEGVDAKGVEEFLGLPYAAPPVGDLRWRPPASAKPWSGVLKAARFGPACAQVTTLGVFAGPANANEDCLTLNVFTPRLGAAAKLPVIVWIHGGGNVDGASSDYDASRLASLGQAVVVTINYRLGLFGWLADPALDAEGHPFANYGLLDQQAAMRWVKDNISGFGGDPGNVTVGGQSAGSVDAEAQVASPLAAGLFQRAIFQSIVVDGSPLAVAEKQGDAFAEAAGCGKGAAPEVAACLRRLPADKVMQMQGTESTSGPYVNFLVADGQIVPAGGMFAAFRAGKFNHMPIMSGSVHDEQNFSAAIEEYFEAQPHALTADEYDKFVKAYPPAVAEEYRTTRYETPQRARNAIGTDSAVCPQLMLNRILAPQTPVYAYEFNDPTAPFFFPPLPGFEPMAYHTADIQYLFVNWHGGPKGKAHGLNAAQRRLSDALIRAWTNFARTGDPNGDGAPNWPAFKPDGGRSGLYLSERLPEPVTITDAAFEADHRCAFWTKARPQ
jgi:para-nitrobenzyl esterase